MSDTRCVYVPEWVEVFSNGTLMGREACVQAYQREWEGKVGPEEWRLQSSGKREPVTWTLEILLPNLRAEFKDKERAERIAGLNWKGAVVVQWGSEEEEALLEYGTRQLKTA